MPGVEALHATFVDYRYALHTHEAHAIALVDRGAAAFDLEGRRYEASQGSVFVIPAGWAHTGQSASRAGYSYRVLYVDPSAVIDDLELETRPSPKPPSTVVHHRSRLARTLSAFHDRLAEGETDLETDELDLVALAGVVAGLLVGTTMPTPRRIDHAAVRHAVAYLHEHWNRQVTLRQIADHTSLSPYRLARIFQREVGLPPSTYQRQLRVDHAKGDLRRGLSVAEVALRCGFYDQAHLTRHFHRMTGVTPLVYARA